MCISVFIAISMLGGFHLYLLLTNQSTIEFQINSVNAREARSRGEQWRNPYSLGCWGNVQQVMFAGGTKGGMYAFFPWTSGLFRPHEFHLDPHAGLSFPKPGQKYMV